MGIVEDFINKIKLRENYRFDKEVADLIGVDKYVLANSKKRGQLPSKYIKWYCNNYQIELEDFYKDIKLTNTNMDLGGSNIMEAQKIINNQDRLIKYQEKEINELRSILLKKEKQTMSNPIWEELDYDVMTTQIYETDNYAYFESYEIIRHHTFFAKLGYDRHEADIKYEGLKRFVDAKNIPQDNNKISWLFVKNKTDDNMLEWEKTKNFFLASKKKNMINALEMFKVTYKHKDGSSIPAIINVLYDFKGDSSVSKIKFITD